MTKKIVLDENISDNIDIELYYLGRIGKPLCQLSNNEHLFYKHGDLYTYNSDTNIAERYCILLQSPFLRLISRFRIIERILRLEPRSALFDGSNLFISQNGQMITVDYTSKKILCQYKYRDGMLNPLTISSISDIKGFDDMIVFGEYWGNPNSEKVRIFAKCYDCEDWGEIYSFPENSVKHVHNIIPDKEHDCVYIFTGDADICSGIWEARDNFKTVTPLAIGKQEFRACQAIPTNSGLLYATDSPLVSNKLNQIQFGFQNREPIVTTIADLPGSCIYGCYHNNKWFIFSTTVEGIPDQPILKRFLSQKLGVGIHDRFTHIYIYHHSIGLKEIQKHEKDRIPMGLGQFGTVMFSPSAMNVYLYPVAVKKYDGKTLLLKISDKNRN